MTNPRTDASSTPAPPAAGGQRGARCGSAPEVEDSRATSAWRARWARPLEWGGILAAALAFVVLGVGLFGSGGNDDSHITYWAAHALAEYGQLVNYSGERIEQSSSLALTLLLALLRWWTLFDVPTLGYGVGLLCGVGAVIASARLARRLGPVSAVGVAWLTATAAPLLYWGTSGMEAPLVALTGVWVVAELGADAPPGDRAFRRWLRLALGFSCFAAVRPETALELPALCLGWLVLELVSCWRRASPLARRRRHFALVSFGLSLGLCGALFAFRQLYFGQWLPNPVLVKVAFGPDAWRFGARYLWSTFAESASLPLLLAPLAVVVALVCWLREPEVDRTALAATALAAGHLLSVAALGGDWMGMGRFVLPVLPLLSYLTGWLLVSLGSVWAGWRGPQRPGSLRLGGLARSLLVAAAGLQLAFAVRLPHTARGNGTDALDAWEIAPRVRGELPRVELDFSEIANKAHLRDAPVAHRLLQIIERAAPTPERPLWLMSGQSGMVPFHIFRRHFGSLMYTDAWGLTSRRHLPCIPKERFKRTAGGVPMSYGLFFAHSATFRSKCGVERPDVIFSTHLSRGFREMLLREGYDIVYYQRGLMANRREPSFFRSNVAFDAFIAVERQLAHTLALSTERVLWHWFAGDPPPGAHPRGAAVPVAR